MPVEDEVVVAEANDLKGDGRIRERVLALLPCYFHMHEAGSEVDEGNCINLDVTKAGPVRVAAILNKRG
jgi:hypothetical protein